MTLDDFSTQLARLSAQFGKTAYSSERAKVIWDAVKDLPAGWLDGVVSDFIGGCRQAPLLNEFRDQVGRFREKESSAKKAAEPTWTGPVRYSCDYCGDTGVYLCTHKSLAGQWAFRCHCYRGSSDGRIQIPQIKHMHSVHGFLYQENR